MWVNKSQWTTRKYLEKTYTIKVYRTLLNFLSRGSRGKKDRQYISTFMVFAVMAANTFLRVGEGIFNPPPEHSHNPTYPTKLVRDTGIVIARSPRMVLLPVYIISGAIVAIFGILPLFSGRAEAWLLLLVIMIGCGAWIYFTYLIRLHYVLVIHENRLSRWKGIIATEEKFVDGVDIKEVIVDFPRPYWFWQMLDLQKVVVDFSNDTVDQTDKKAVKRNRFVMLGVGNGDAVKALLQQLTTHGTDVQDDTNRLVRRQVSLLMVMVRVMSNGGRIFTQFLNMQLELLREKNELSREANAYLKRIADKLDPLLGSELTPTKAFPTIQPPIPKSPPKGHLPGDGMETK